MSDKFARKAIYAEVLEYASGPTPKLAKLLPQVKRGLRSGALATVDACAAFQRLIEAVRRSDKKELTEALKKNKDIRH